MKKLVKNGFLLIVLLISSSFIWGKEKEISVEDMYYEDMKNEQKVSEDVAFVQKIQELLEKNDLDGAIKLYNNLSPLLNENLELKIILASLYISKADYKKAIEVANEVLKKDPENIDAYEIISYASKASGDTKTYKEINKKLLEKDPNNSAANITMGNDYILNKKYKNAQECFRKVLSSEKNNEDALFGYALSTYYLDDVKKAEETIDKLLDVNAKSAQGNALKGKICAEKYNYSQATDYYEKAINYGGPNYNYYLELGMCYRQRNMNTKAIEVWEKALDLNSSYFLCYAYLAGIYDELNETQTALNYYHKVIETNPDYYFAYEETAILEYHMGNYKNAIAYFEKAYSYYNNFSYKMMIASSYLKLKDLINAKKVLESVMKGLDRESVEYNMARFYHDSYSKNAETALSQKLGKIDNSTNRGKMLFYMGLYYEINGFDEMANEYYSKVTSMQAPMFFEYRLAEWSLNK